MAKFSQQVNEFALEIDKANEDIVKQTVIEFYRAIILGSPVDTGRFRGNWFLTFRSPSTRRVRRTDRSGRRTVARMTDKVLKAQAIDSFILTNNLPYSEVIEFGRYPGIPKRGTRIKGGGFEKRSSGGFSKQAPNGVVRVNAIRFVKLLEEQAKKRNYGSI